VTATHRIHSEILALREASSTMAFSSQAHKDLRRELGFGCEARPGVPVGQHDGFQLRLDERVDVAATTRCVPRSG
jgi:hypothetical protein